MSESIEHITGVVTLTDVGKRLHPTLNLTSTRFTVPGNFPCLPPAQAAVIDNYPTMSSNRFDKMHPLIKRIKFTGDDFVSSFEDHTPGKLGLARGRSLSQLPFPKKNHNTILSSGIF